MRKESSAMLSCQVAGFSHTICFITANVEVSVVATNVLASMTFDTMDQEAF